MAFSFPENPADGTIFEPVSGVFFQFSSKQNAWIRVDGLEALGVATPVRDGLMPKEDLTKLNGLLVPPPRISLTSDDCSFTFDRGTIGFRSSKEHLFIDHELELRNKVNGEVIVEKQPWIIHENTFGYNFRVDTDELIQEMQSRGNLTFRGTVGEQGEQGDQGDDGEDELDTGPIGESGDDGQNIPFPGILTTETSGDFDVVDADNRAIVDAKTERISKDENFLVLTRANIGNLDACPSLIRPKSFQSPLVLVIDDNLSRAQIRKDEVNADCQTTCSICSGLFTLDMQALLDQIFERFKDLVLELKAVKEQLANSWLVTMINVFNQQRDAICCAIENCESRKQNQDERRYLEQLRVQAAQGGFKLDVNGQEEKVIIDLEADKEDCPVSEGGQAIVGGENCDVCLVEITVDGRINAGAVNNAVVASLPAGEFVAEIEDCCIQHGRKDLVFVGDQYNGRVNLQYRTENGDPRTITIPDHGNFRNNDEARDAYIGQCFSFSHSGGDISVWFSDIMPEDNSGLVTLCIKGSACFEFGTDPTGDVTIGPIAPESCEMAASQVSWYERGWRTGAVCGAFVLIDGQKFIIAKRSIGVDLTCGGGESLSTPCISQFIDAGEGHPAIAFPTIDGDEFIGKPISGTQTFVEDSDLSDRILEKIRNGEAIEVKGDAATEIPFILFPSF